MRLTYGSVVTTTNGNIDIDGTGGGGIGSTLANRGVLIASGSSLSAGGAGTLTINGTAEPAPPRMTGSFSAPAAAPAWPTAT